MTELSRRDFGTVVLKSAGGTLLASSLVPPKSNAGNRQPRRPNIVFITSDQHTYKCTGYAGHPVVQTPNLDRIAAQGVVFESNYCGNPVCVPSRTSMMTGMYASDCNSFCNSTVWDGSHPLWGKRLKDAGYHCWATGKMDLNDKFDSGFVEVDVDHGHVKKPDITSLLRRPTIYRIGERDAVDGASRDERSDDAGKTEGAVQFIKEKSKNLKQPWVCYVGLYQPHPAFRAWKPHFDHYYPNLADVPNIPPGFLEDLHLVFQELRHFKRIATPIPDERIRRCRAAYYGMITELDEYIGRLYDALKDSGQLENTVFVYTSDHGESLGEHGLWLKNNLYDMAARVPLVMAGAGLPKARRIGTPCGHVDVAATLLDMAGVPRPPDFRGHSLLPLMLGKSGNHPGFAFSESHSEGNVTGSFLIRKGDWKYIHFHWYDDLLFNLKEDPGEFNNRIDDPAAASAKTELKSILDSLVDPEEVTVRAFRMQEEMLARFAGTMTEEELFNLFRSRLGPGQSRVMVNKLKRM